jgi:hypothetical protein
MVGGMQSIDESDQDGHIRQRPIDRAAEAFCEYLPNAIPGQS